MGISFTNKQLEVIETRNSNILVSAAAGSGKTAVLVERIIRMICDSENPVDIDRLLIVTFTKAAAAEMRERISMGIRKKMEEENYSAHIEKQSTLLHNALITTIDSFCLYLVKNHFHEIGLDPSFRVADEGEVKLLKQEVLNEILEKHFVEKDEKFLNAVDSFCMGARDQLIEQYILNLHQFALSYPWPKKWLLERKKDYKVVDLLEIEESQHGIYLKKHLIKMCMGGIEALKQVEKICNQPDGPYMYGDMIEAEISYLESFLKCKTLQEWEGKLSEFTFGRLPTKKDDSVSAIKREQAKNIRNGVKKSLQDLGQRFFATPLELSFQQMVECNSKMEVLVDLTIEFMDTLREKKQDKKMIDFQDMEHYALEILWKKDGDEMIASSVAKEYRTFFHEILIDEYQDSNLVQEYLLKAISGEEENKYNLFMVGDVKQSIYKFRLARPELFLEKQSLYEAGENHCKRIDLSTNFRSRDSIIDSVNGVFSKVMSREVGGIEYDEAAALYLGANYPRYENTKSELWLIENPDKESEINKKELEGEVIAKRIKQLREEYMVTDKETGLLRQTKFSDIVILLRTNSGWDEVFKKVLQENGIPAFIASKTGYFQAKEVQEILNFLRVLDNPTNDIPLFGVMKSIFGNFSEEEIGILRSCDKNLSLWEVVLKEKEENIKYQNFFAMIERFRSYTIYMPIRELLQTIVMEFDYLHYVTAMPLGSKRKANVEMLFTKASAFEKTSYFGLFHFIRYIEQLEKYEVDYGEADLLDENADVVRIMSIHKSKGLEFPITFLAGMSKRFNMQDLNQAIIMDIDFGIGCDYVNTIKRIRNKTLQKNVLVRKMREDNLAEELRILYVALTRAKEKLIMTGTMDKVEEKMELLSGASVENLSYHSFMESSSYLDFILPILNKEQIEVHVSSSQEILGEDQKEQIKLAEKDYFLEHFHELVLPQQKEDLLEQFGKKYEKENLAKLHTKTTVSELKIAAMEEKDEGAYHTFEEKKVGTYIPTFRIEKEKSSGAQIGNAYHKAMELLECTKVYDGIFEKFPKDEAAFAGELNQERLLNKIEELLEQEVALGKLKLEYRTLIQIKKIANFFMDNMGYRMWKAEREGNLYKEQPFVLGISAKRLSEEFPEEEKLLIQGIIDLFFIEEGQIILLDYKTDRISNGEELWNRYETQVDYYKEAIEKIMNLPIKEEVLYSFSLEKSICRKNNS